MTVQTNNNSISYVGNGSTVHFDYDYLILNASHLKVYFGDVLQTSGHVVSGVSSQTGGTVSFAVAPPNGANITLIRDVPFLQLTDYQPYDAFPAESHERALDLLTMMAQQLKDASDRSMQYPVGGNKWDAKGNEIINAAAGGSDNSAANVGQVKSLIASLAGPDSAAQLRQELGEADGANLVGAGDYGYIDSYTGDASHIKCYGISNVFDGGHGDFYLDVSDTTSPSSGVCRVDALGRRWKRQVTGDFDWQWWGVKGDGVADDWAAISKMISDVNVFSGPSGVFAISQPLPIGEGLRVTITDNAGANAAGLIKPHSSVANPSSFDFFFADSVQVEHVNISGLRFFGGRHVIRGNFPSGVSSGFISQVNFEDCVFQDLAGYAIESTNSVFAIDFHKCRLLRCGGVNIGYGVNVLKFRQCGFENMRREYIKLDGAGSTLPSASIGLYGCRCEGYDTSPTASKCFDISGYGRLFNFEITDGTYFENVFTDIGTISGVKGLNLNNLNLTNSDSRVYTLNITDCTGVIGNFESLVSTVVTLSGSSAIEQVGDISGGVTIRTLGSSNLKSDLRVRKEVAAPAVTALYKFNCSPTGASGASVFSASGGEISVTYVSSKTDDGTPIFSSKTFEVIVTKMFGGTMAATVFETGNAGNLGGGSLTLTASGASATEITLSVAFTGSGSYSAGAVIMAEANMKPVSSSENTIYVTKA